VGFAGQARRAEGEAEVRATAALQFAAGFEYIFASLQHRTLRHREGVHANKPCDSALCRQLRTVASRP